MVPPGLSPGLKSRACDGNLLHRRCRRPIRLRRDPAARQGVDQAMRGFAWRADMGGYSVFWLIGVAVVVVLVLKLLGLI